MGRLDSSSDEARVLELIKTLGGRHHFPVSDPELLLELGPEWSQRRLKLAVLGLLLDHGSGVKRFSPGFVVYAQDE